MVPSANGPEGGLRAPFGLGVLMLLLLPSEVGYQDLAALIARQPPVVDRSQKASFASPFGTIHEAKFIMPRPVGASISPSLEYTLVGLDPNNADLTGSIRERWLGESAMQPSPFGGQIVDRSRKGDYGIVRQYDRVARKGDRLKPRSDEPEQQAPVFAQRQGAAETPRSLEPPTGVAEDEFAGAGEARVAGIAAGQSKAPSVAAAPAAPAALQEAGSEGESPVRPVTSLSFAAADVDPALRAARLYFSIDPMGQKLGAIEPWAPGEEPQFEDASAVALGVDSDRTPFPAASESNIKLAALPPEAFPGERAGIVDAPVERADLPPLPADPSIVTKNGTGGGQTVAPKGEVTGAEQRPKNPAERLGLDEHSRAKSEKCLAEATDCEARGDAM